MPSVETRPYLSASPGCVIVEPWVYERGNLPEVLPQHLIDWDPVQNIALKRSVLVRMERFRNECGLHADAEVALTVSWRSPGSGQRGLAQRRVLQCSNGDLPVAVEAIIPGIELAGAVRIISRLVLHYRGSADSQIAASRPGSILWEEQVQLQLEGIGSRFPMEVVDFGAIGLPLGASWRLHWNRGDLHAQAMGCLCLLLNKRHRRITVAASRTVPDPETRAIWSAINLGVAREIIVGVLNDEAFLAAEGEFEEETVGAVANGLLERAFPGQSPQAALERLQNSPDRFECDLQAAFNLFDPAS